MKTTRHTKIIATLGPATDAAGELEKLILAGTNLIRLNFSHDDFKAHQLRAEKARQIATSHGVEIGILADMQGPKIRIGGFSAEEVFLKEGQVFTIDTNHPLEQGDETVVGTPYQNLPQEVAAGQTLLLDDGKLQIKITQVTDTKVVGEVMIGGMLSANKGVNIQGGGLSANALTEKDLQNIIDAVAIGADFIAISFVKTADDLKKARFHMEQAGGHAHIIAKIETALALDNIEPIIAESDGIMVARGDLGVEIGPAEVPAVQKSMIQLARDMNKAVITATQMMETMISESHPTRAEVSDIANAIIDGTDGVMLSAETAKGRHPARVVEMMAQICLGAEKNPMTQQSSHRVQTTFDRADESIALASMYIANHFDIKGIITLTESGATPLWMSRIRSAIPIFALSRHVGTLRKMALLKGVFPVFFDPTQIPPDLVRKRAVDLLLGENLIEPQDNIIITQGDHIGILGGTNTLKILTAAHAQ